MAPLGKPLDLVELLGKAKNRVNRIGVELEGGWSKLPAGTKLVHDGSVRFSDRELLSGLKHHGELPSPPLAVDKREVDRDSLVWYPIWIKAFYPQYVNVTCGMHVHMSFKTAFAYQRLMHPSYPGSIVKYVSEWAVKEKLPKDHPLWHRLEGKSEYCQHQFYADEQAKMSQKDHDRHRTGHRYTVVNFCHGRTNTIECRLLPMMSTYEQALSAVENILNITNAFLTATAKREERLKSTFVVDEDCIREEQRIEV